MIWYSAGTAHSNILHFLRKNIIRDAQSRGYIHKLYLALHIDRFVTHTMWAFCCYEMTVGEVYARTPIPRD